MSQKSRELRCHYFCWHGKLCDNGTDSMRIAFSFAIGPEEPNSYCEVQGREFHRVTARTSKCDMTAARLRLLAVASPQTSASELWIR